MAEHDVSHGGSTGKKRPRCAAARIVRAGGADPHAGRRYFAVGVTAWSGSQERHVCTGTGSLHSFRAHFVSTTWEDAWVFDGSRPVGCGSAGRTRTGCSEERNRQLPAGVSQDPQYAGRRDDDAFPFPRSDNEDAHERGTRICRLRQRRADGPSSSCFDSAPVPSTIPPVCPEWRT